MIMYNGDEHFIPCTGTNQSVVVESETAPRAYQNMWNKRSISFESIGTSREDEEFAHLEKLNLSSLSFVIRGNLRHP